MTELLVSDVSTGHRRSSPYLPSSGHTSKGSPSGGTGATGNTGRKTVRGDIEEGSRVGKEEEGEEVGVKGGEGENEGDRKEEGVGEGKEEEEGEEQVKGEDQRKDKGREGVRKPAQTSSATPKPAGSDAGVEATEQAENEECVTCATATTNHDTPPLVTGSTDREAENNGLTTPSQNAATTGGHVEPEQPMRLPEGGDETAVSRVFPSGLLKPVLTVLRTKLTRESWKRHPAAKHGLLWCLRHLKVGYGKMKVGCHSKMKNC